MVSARQLAYKSAFTYQDRGHSTWCLLHLPASLTKQGLECREDQRTRGRRLLFTRDCGAARCHSSAMLFVASMPTGATQSGAPVRADCKDARRSTTKMFKHRLCCKLMTVGSSQGKATGRWLWAKCQWPVSLQKALCGSRQELRKAWCWEQGFLFGGTRCV